MLVLSRKKNEFIDIDDGKIEVVVVEIRRDHVRIGIRCDRSIPVHRREVQEMINLGRAAGDQKNNQKSVETVRNAE